MVADLEKHLVRRGLRLISAQEGPALFVAELLHGRKGESEIILAGGAEALARPTHPVRPPPAETRWNPVLTRSIRPAAGSREPSPVHPSAVGHRAAAAARRKSGGPEGGGAGNGRRPASTSRDRPDRSGLHPQLRAPSRRLAAGPGGRDRRPMRRPDSSRALQRLDDPRCTADPRRVRPVLLREPLHPGGKLAFLFPGEGAQYLGMLGDVRRAFPEVETFFAECDAKSRHGGDVGSSLTEVFLPPDDAGPDELAHAEEELRRIDHAMISVMMADWRTASGAATAGAVARRRRRAQHGRAGGALGRRLRKWKSGDGVCSARVRETMEVMRREEESAQARYVLLAVGAGARESG